jgi:hypothetical protein
MGQVMQDADIVNEFDGNPLWLAAEIRRLRELVTALRAERASAAGQPEAKAITIARTGIGDGEAKLPAGKLPPHHELVQEFGHYLARVLRFETPHEKRAEALREARERIAAGEARIQIGRCLSRRWHMLHVEAVREEAGQEVSPMEIRAQRLAMALGEADFTVWQATTRSANEKTLLETQELIEAIMSMVKTLHRVHDAKAYIEHRRRRKGARRQQTAAEQAWAPWRTEGERLVAGGMEPARARRTLWDIMSAKGRGEPVSKPYDEMPLPNLRGKGANGEGVFHDKHWPRSFSQNMKLD